MQGPEKIPQLKDIRMLRCSKKGEVSVGPIRVYLSKLRSTLREQAYPEHRRRHRNKSNLFQGDMSLLQQWQMEDPEKVPMKEETKTLMSRIASEVPSHDTIRYFLSAQRAIWGRQGQCQNFHRSKEII